MVLEEQILELASYDNIVKLIIWLSGIVGIKSIIQWLWVKFTNPLIEIADVRLSRHPYEEFVPVYGEFGEIVDASPEPARTKVSWRVFNKIRLFIFSKDVPDVYARYNFERVDSDAPQDYVWTSDTNPWPLLAPDQDIPMSFTLNRKYLPNGDYKLRLNIMSNDNVIKSCTKILKVTGFGSTFSAE